MSCNLDLWHLSILNEFFVIYVDSPTTPYIGKCLKTSLATFKYYDFVVFCMLQRCCHSKIIGIPNFSLGV